MCPDHLSGSGSCLWLKQVQTVSAPSVRTIKMKTYLLFLLVAIDAFVDAKHKQKSTIKRAACPEIDYQCTNGLCIQQEWLCDTENDCGNLEDEVGCPTDCSGPNQFKCTNQRCVALEYRCDGDNDCLDNTDEQGCESWACPVGELKCATTNLCIDHRWLCDGDNDCRDNWDEQPQNCSP